jgi:hypothetical protein
MYLADHLFGVGSLATFIPLVHPSLCQPLYTLLEAPRIIVRP